jgi:hypothetical protein
MMENCPGLIAADVPRVVPAALRLALNPDQVRVTYSGHSTFLIESPQGVRVATDYNDYVRPAVVPDIATMNHAHDSHFTDRPDPRIPHVLRGWGPSPTQPARHDVNVRDVRVRNVRPTSGLERRHRAARQLDLHLRNGEHVHRPSRHLHHTLNQQQLNESRASTFVRAGRRSATLDLEGMFEVLPRSRRR